MEFMELQGIKLSEPSRHPTAPEYCTIYVKVNKKPQGKEPLHLLFPKSHVVSASKGNKAAKKVDVKKVAKKVDVKKGANVKDYWHDLPKDRKARRRSQTKSKSPHQEEEEDEEVIEIDSWEMPPKARRSK